MASVERSGGAGALDLTSTARPAARGRFPVPGASDGSGDPGRNSIDSLDHAAVARTVSATVELTVRFDAVPDDAAVAVAAGRREHMNRAFKTVEHVRRSVAGSHFEGLVVVVAAEFAGGHVPAPDGDCGVVHPGVSTGHNSLSRAPPPNARRSHCSLTARLANHRAHPRVLRYVRLNGISPGRGQRRAPQFWPRARTIHTLRSTSVAGRLRRQRLIHRGFDSRCHHAAERFPDANAPHPVQQEDQRR